MAIILPNSKLDEIPSLIFSELRKGTFRKKHPFKNVVLSTVNEKVVQKELDPEIVRKIDDYYLSEREQILAIKDRVYNS